MRKFFSNSSCIAVVFLFQLALHKVELGRTIRNALRQPTLPLHSALYYPRPETHNGACPVLILFYFH